VPPVLSEAAADDDDDVSRGRAYLPFESNSRLRDDGLLWGCRG
jgi:hypothetical protein